MVAVLIDKLKPVTRLMDIHPVSPSLRIQAIKR
jgi:hypothetical protein